MRQERRPGIWGVSLSPLSVRPAWTQHPGTGSAAGEAALELLLGRMGSMADQAWGVGCRKRRVKRGTRWQWEQGQHEPPVSAPTRGPVLGLWLRREKQPLMGRGVNAANCSFPPWSVDFRLGEGRALCGVRGRAGPRVPQSCAAPAGGGVAGWQALREG